MSSYHSVLEICDAIVVMQFIETIRRILGLIPEIFGETIFVPGNWWHCVVNLDDTIAVTQNYVGRHNFPQVWRSCRVERPCWSHRWLRAMEAKCPDLAGWAKRMNFEEVMANFG
eukprot:s1580_g3.t1